jgi:GMP synthase (glutamine-hydrolysing)
MSPLRAWPTSSARVYPNPHKEIGWFPVSLTGEAALSKFFKNFPKDFNAFHWHGETFDIPQDGIQLAGSTACKNQAFSYGDSVMAIQFHLDVQEEGARNLLH